MPQKSSSKEKSKYDSGFESIMYFQRSKELSISKEQNTGNQVFKGYV